MNNLINLILAAMFFCACNSDKTQPIESSTENVGTSIDSTIPRVTGIGGIFFKAENPEEVKDWYRTNLGFAIDEFGAPFEFRNASRPNEINYLNWDIFVDTTNYFSPSVKEFMINYRVQNIEGLVDKMKNNGVTVIDEIATYEYGKFVHVMDLIGNKIELWEPNDSVLTKMERETTK